MQRREEFKGDDYMGYIQSSSADVSLYNPSDCRLSICLLSLDLSRVRAPSAVCFQF